MQNSSNNGGQHNQMSNGAPNRQPVRPQQQGQRPVRPNMQGQQPVRPQQGQQSVRPQQQQSHHVRPQQNAQNIRPQQHTGVRQPRTEYEQSPSRMQQMSEQQFDNQQQYQDNNFEDFNSAVVNDTVAENKARGKKVKKVKEKKVVTPEQKKKRLIIGGCVAGGLVVILIIALIVNNLMQKNNQHINTTPNILNQGNQQDTQNTVDDQQNQQEETEQVEDTKIEQETTTPQITNIQAKECSESNPLDLDEYSYMNLIVNTKTAEDKSYTDKEAKVYFKLSNVITGYDSVSEYIDTYNTTNKLNKNIKMPSSLEYYTMSNGTEMVMLEFEMLYPSDFPTSGSTGYVYRIPQASIEVYGIQDIDIDDIADENVDPETYDPSKYLVVDDVIYNVSKLTDISVYELDADNGIKVGEPIYFRYITALPVGASSDVYGIKLNVDLDTEDLGKDTAMYWFKGQSITASEEWDEAQKEIANQQVIDEESQDDNMEENEEEQSSEE